MLHDAMMVCHLCDPQLLDLNEATNKLEKKNWN